MNADILINLNPRDDWNEPLEGQVAIEIVTDLGRQVLGITDDAVQALNFNREAGIDWLIEKTDHYTACHVAIA